MLITRADLAQELKLVRRLNVFRFFEKYKEDLDLISYATYCLIPFLYPITRLFGLVGALLFIGLIGILLLLAKEVEIYVFSVYSKIGPQNLDSFLEKFRSYDHRSEQLKCPFCSSEDLTMGPSQTCPSPYAKWQGSGYDSHLEIRPVSCSGCNLSLYSKVSLNSYSET